MRNSQRSGHKNKQSLVLKVIVALLIIAIGVVGVMAVYAYNNYINNNRMMQAAVDDGAGRIYRNVYINGVNVGGMTREAAELMLRKQFVSDLHGNTIAVNAGEASLQFTFADFGARYDFSAAVEQADQYAKSGTLKERYDLVTALETQPYNISYVPEYAFDRTNIISMLEPLRGMVDVEPVDSTIKRENGQFIVSASRIGRVVNIEAAADMVIAVLETEKSGVVTAPVDEIPPSFDESDMAAVQSLIGTYTTKAAGGNPDRNQNIKTALSKINDVVLHPEEVFSTNKHFGAMTYDNGYRNAPVIVGGQLEDGMGGGVCQVSSTLYNAVLMAELSVVERMNHSMKVTYVDYGFDATLAGDYIDFKFSNDTDSPVFIEAMFLNNAEVVVNLYGREVHAPGRTLKFNKQLVETVPPPGEPIETEDPSLPAGERVIKQKPATGYRYQVYKTVLEDGVEKGKELVNTSYYRAARGETLVGTGGAGAVDGDHIASGDPVLGANGIDVDAGYDPAPIQPGDTIGEWYLPPTVPEDVTPPVYVPEPQELPPTIPQDNGYPLITDPVG